MKHLSILLGMTSILLIGKTGFGQNKITVATGQKIHQTTNQINTVTQTIQGNEMEIKSNTTLDIDLEVKEAGTNIKLINTIGRLQLHSEVMGNSTNFDSDKKEDKNAQIGQLLKDIINKPIETNLSSDGKLVKSDKDKSANESAENLIGGSIDEFAKESFLAIPTSLKVGDSFEEVNDAADKNNSKKATYTVQSINGNDAEIVFKGTETTKRTKNIQGMEAVVTANSTTSGTLTIDIKSGLIKEKKSIVEGKGITEVMGQSIPFTLKGIISSNSK
jgi:hypothetical protein